jgi:nicotinate-nucleotide pyrophosphorylase (carboxylating)
VNPADHAELLARALEEDLGSRGDVTGNSVIPADATSLGNVVVRDGGVVAGLALMADVFTTVDPAVEFELRTSDGDRVRRGQVLAAVAGRARSLLAAERTALNFLGRMSGVATATAAYVEAVAGTGARITDTRKTLPGLRALDKYAVTVGGGVNHRMGLHDAVMIKDNHIVVAGDISRAVELARADLGPNVMIVVEVDRLTQLEEVLSTRANRVLLDNMDIETLTRAVSIVDGDMTVEASGGVTLGTVRSIAETGVDLISVGAITHSAPQLDVALDFVPGPLS